MCPDCPLPPLRSHRGNESSVPWLSHRRLRTATPDGREPPNAKDLARGELEGSCCRDDGVPPAHEQTLHGRRPSRSICVWMAESCSCSASKVLRMSSSSDAT